MKNSPRNEKTKMMSKTLLLVTAALLGAGVNRVSAQPLPPSARAAIREARAAGPALYQQGREEQSQRETRTLKLGAEGELELGNVAGDIVVTRGSGREATVEIVKTARARTVEDARQMLGLVEVSVTERNGRAEVRTLYPQGDERVRGERRRNANVTVAYTVSAPPGTRLTVGSVSGSISVTDIKGDLSLNAVSGGIRIANAGRISAAQSVSGTVEILDTRVEGGLEVQSVSGNVLLRNVNARRVEAGTVSGSVSLQDMECERVEGHSVSGNVEYGGTLASKGRYELSSHSGDVRLSVGGGTGFELEANSFSGSVRSDLPLSSRRGDRDDSPEFLKHRTLRGTHGDGSAVVSITTFSGNVVISKR